jgi:hypothetical protein
VASSLFGACFSPMLIFRRPNTPHTRVATHRMLSEIRPPELSHGTAESCRITETMTVPKRADQASEYQEHEDPTAIRLNRLLEAPSINAGQRACPVRARTMTICCAASSGDLLPPSPPAEKPAARQDQTWQHPRWNALHLAQTPAVLDHSSALAQGDGRARPAFAGARKVASPDKSDEFARAIYPPLRRLPRLLRAVAARPAGHLFEFHPVAPHAPKCLGACIVCGRLHRQLQCNYACTTR